MKSLVLDELKKINPKISYSIDDFIGVFDGFVSEELCKAMIDYYEDCEKAGITHVRQAYHNHGKDKIDDESVTFVNQSHLIVPELRFKSTEFEDAFWNACYKLYAEKYAVLNHFSPHNIYTTKIQRTEKEQGYHVWHSDAESRAMAQRLLVFIMYLNDVKEGGETEFLYLSKRIKPKMGRILIFPATYTHTHRGNPPISNTKYIFTGWVEL